MPKDGSSGVWGTGMILTRPGENVNYPDNLRHFLQVLAEVHFGFEYILGMPATRGGGSINLAHRKALV